MPTDNLVADLIAQAKVNHTLEERLRIINFLSGCSFRWEGDRQVLDIDKRDLIKFVSGAADEPETRA